MLPVPHFFPYFLLSEISQNMSEDILLFTAHIHEETSLKELKWISNIPLEIKLWS